MRTLLVTRGQRLVRSLKTAAQTYIARATHVTGVASSPSLQLGSISSSISSTLTRYSANKASASAAGRVVPLVLGLQVPLVASSTTAGHGLLHHQHNANLLPDNPRSNRPGSEPPLKHTDYTYHMDHGKESQQHGGRDGEDDDGVYSEHRSQYRKRTRSIQTLTHALQEVQNEPRILRILRVARRILTHFFLFAPVVAMYPVCYVLSRLSNNFMELWWDWFMWQIQVSGPSFIKFGQWASTRPDLFSAAIIEKFKLLHESVRPHGIDLAKATISYSFGEGWEDFLRLDEDPIGAGCVAQVYRAKLHRRGKELDVAVKVIHPKVQKNVLDDIAVLRFFAWAIELIPFFKWTSASDSVREFEKMMVRQLDLRNEARNMMRLRENFRSRSEVIVPEVMCELVSENVLVETFEDSLPITVVYDSDMKMRKKLASRCVKYFFEMMFHHNLLHGDLHPGNLRIRGVDEDGVVTGDKLEVVMLDAGIVTELSPTDRVNFIELFSAIAHKDGKLAARLMLERARLKECEDEEAFIAEVDELISSALAKGLRMKKIKMGELLQRVLQLMCSHKVKIESNFTSTIIAIMVAEGVGRSLDPDLDLLAAASPYLLVEMAKRKLLPLSGASEQETRRRREHDV